MEWGYEDRSESPRTINLLCKRLATQGPREDLCMLLKLLRPSRVVIDDDLPLLDSTDHYFIHSEGGNVKRCMDQPLCSLCVAVQCMPNELRDRIKKQAGNGIDQGVGPAEETRERASGILSETPGKFLCGMLVACS